MKTRIQLALMGCLASVVAHLYLTLHYYPLKFGYAAGESVCNLSAKFNCDAAAASNFSSVFGIPLSVFGMVFNLVLFFMMLTSWLEWTEQPERLKRFALLLSGLSCAASLVMLVISLTQLNSYCLFCLSCYVLSFIIFFSYKGLLREKFFAHIGGDVPELFTHSRAILLALVAIPAGAYVTHLGFIQNYRGDKMDQYIVESINNWTAAPKQEFIAKPTLVMGPPAAQASLVLAEFADFRCSHCKHASYALDAFAKANPDVRFEYYSYPLDGACNDKIGQANNISCHLAYLDVCADKEGKGWEMHDLLFKIQDDVNSRESLNDLNPLLNQSAQALGLNWDKLQACIGDPTTVDAVKAQAKQGNLVNVQGTPTFFANGRNLEGGQLLPVLQAARAKSLELKRGK